VDVGGIITSGGVTVIGAGLALGGIVIVRGADSGVTDWPSPGGFKLTPAGRPAALAGLPEGRSSGPAGEVLVRLALWADSVSVYGKFPSASGTMGISALGVCRVLVSLGVLPVEGMMRVAIERKLERWFGYWWGSSMYRR
jgi:hypothetical protein